MCYREKLIWVRAFHLADPGPSPASQPGSSACSQRLPLLIAINLCFFFPCQMKIWELYAQRCWQTLGSCSYLVGFCLSDPWRQRPVPGSQSSPAAGCRCWYYQTCSAIRADFWLTSSSFHHSLIFLNILLCVKNKT